MGVLRVHQSEELAFPSSSSRNLPTRLSVARQVSLRMRETAEEINDHLFEGRPAQRGAVRVRCRTSAARCASTCRGMVTAGGRDRANSTSDFLASRTSRHHAGCGRPSANARGHRSRLRIQPEEKARPSRGRQGNRAIGSRAQRPDRSSRPLGGIPRLPRRVRCLEQTPCRPDGLTKSRCSRYDWRPCEEAVFLRAGGLPGVRSCSFSSSRA